MTPNGTVGPNGVFYGEDGRKTFVPLENNPEVFTRLGHRLGLAPDLYFCDVYGVDDADLISLVPRPAHALVFIVPAPVYHGVRARQVANGELAYPKALTYDGSGDDEPVVWFRQTIGHACGLMALLHGAANGAAADRLVPGSDLARLLAAAVPLEPGPRADLLYGSRELEDAHMEFAVTGDSAPPSSREPNGYHFISFVKGRDGHLYELEGSWGGPIDHGPLGEDEDVLGEAALDAGVRKFTGAAGGNLEFSMIALVGGS